MWNNEKNIEKMIFLKEKEKIFKRKDFFLFFSFFIVDVLNQFEQLILST